jgi:hypothetical protein
MENKIKNKNKTKDLWFYAFLRIRGYELSDYVKHEDTNKSEFIFNITNDEWKQLKLDFNKSDLSKGKWFIEEAKDLIFG